MKIIKLVLEGVGRDIAFGGVSVDIKKATIEVDGVKRGSIVSEEEASAVQGVKVETFKKTRVGKGRPRGEWYSINSPNGIRFKIAYVLSSLKKFKALRERPKRP